MKIHSVECADADMAGLEAMLARQGFRLSSTSDESVLRPGEYLKRAFTSAEASLEGARRWTVIWKAEE